MKKPMKMTTRCYFRIDYRLFTMLDVVPGSALCHGADDVNDTRFRNTREVRQHYQHQII